MLHYEIEDGPVTTLTVSLPPELEVRGAEARRPLTSTNGAVRLRDYRIDPAANPRVVELHFAALAGARRESRYNWTWCRQAPLPGAGGRCRCRRRRGRAGDGGYLAYRVQGLEATPARLPAPCAACRLATSAPFWPVATRPDAAALADAYCSSAARAVKAPS